MRTDNPAPKDEYTDTKLRSVRWTEELATVRQLFREYREWLAAHAQAPGVTGSVIPPGLAALDRVIFELPGVYGPPSGDVILAEKGPDLVACGALRALEPKVGEIKRIYVRADHRGPGFGPRLTGALLARARELGYTRVRVDTLGSMTAAIRFYQEMGFKPIGRYWPHPAPGALFFEWDSRADDA